VADDPQNNAPFHAPAFNDGFVNVVVHAWVVDVDLDIDGVDDDKEETEGEVVVRRADGNNAPRKKIILRAVQPEEWHGDLILTRDNGKVKVYDAAEGGNEITFSGQDNVFADTDLPKEFYVQGHEASDSMRDVTLTLCAVEGELAQDKVNFTVLWVDSFDRTFGDDDPQYGSTNANDYANDDVVSDDNDKKSAHNDEHTYPDLAHLGLNKDMDGPRMGWMGEVQAVVHPDDFDPSSEATPETFSLEQDINYKDYKEDTLISSQGYSGNVDANDGPGADWQDVTPCATGKIYYLDAPGLLWSSTIHGHQAETGDVFKTRNNFRVWARYGDVRCAEIYQFYVKFDMQKQEGAPMWQVLDNGNKKSANDAQDSLQP